MRIRAIIAPVLLLLPALAGAQLRPRPPLPLGRPAPQDPAPLPPQAEPVARALAYKRLRLAVESYPLASYMHSPGFAAESGLPSWASLGWGTRVDYRITHRMSAVADVTSSFIGSPTITSTVEIGTRIRAEPSERRANPFVDLRIGYADAYDRRRGPTYDGSQTPGGVGRRSEGWGVLGGVGMDYALTRQFSLTTTGSVMRSRMTSRDVFGVQDPRRFAMTSLRVTLGLRYNPVRLVLPAETDTR